MPPIIDVAVNVTAAEARAGTLGRCYAALLVAVGFFSLWLVSKTGLQGRAHLILFLGAGLIGCATIIFRTRTKLFLSFAYLAGGALLLVVAGAAVTVFFLWAASWAK
jgi:hypothetical protein